MNPELSRAAAKTVQGMPPDIRFPFVEEIEKYETINQVPEPYQSWIRNGWKKTD
jgi:hypothetical protein